MLQLNMLN